MQKVYLLCGAIGAIGVASADTSRAVAALAAAVDAVADVKPIDLRHGVHFSAEIQLSEQEIAWLDEMANMPPRKAYTIQARDLHPVMPEPEYIAKRPEKQHYQGYHKRASRRRW